MATKMDSTRAARLLGKWIQFYGMNDPNAWPAEDYQYVKTVREAMESAIEILSGNTANQAMSIPETIRLLEEWPTIHSMDNPDMWEAVNFPFVRNSLEAINFAASHLKTYQATPR
ncbi:hypothetical protein M1N64_04405 [Peptococcaceae bacterium]|jgi:hypothetical protein|nr:hypothetical protein [Peptococcaceae bacterium]